MLLGELCLEAAHRAPAELCVSRDEPGVFQRHKTAARAAHLARSRARRDGCWGVFDRKCIVTGSRPGYAGAFPACPHPAGLCGQTS